MEQEYKNLIIGYLDHRLGERDTEKFFSWIEEDEKNKELFFEIKAIYETTHSQVDIEKSWQRLLRKREKQLDRRSISPVNYWKKVWEYAAVAAIAVLITSSCFLYFTGGNHRMEGQTIRYTSGTGLLADIIELPDGTHVQLAASSTLHYNSGYGQKNREVYLDGEAFFDVARMEDKPFMVNLGEQTVTALGTQFNILAYSADSTITTTLVKGSVKLETEMHTDKVLLPDQQLVYNKISKSIEIIDNVNTGKIISWTTGYYHFTEETLENILLRMGKILGVRFVISSKNLKDKKFSGKFYSSQNERDIMEIIKLSIPVNYKIEGDQIIITE